MSRWTNDGPPGNILMTPGQPFDLTSEEKKKGQDLCYRYLLLLTRMNSTLMFHLSGTRSCYPPHKVLVIQPDASTLPLSNNSQP